MTPHGLAALTELGRYLTTEILPTVPDALVGELRAAIKILHAVADELNVLPSLLHLECREFSDLQRQAAQTLRWPAPPASMSSTAGNETGADLDPSLDLHALLARHEACLREATHAIEALQRCADEDPRSGESLALLRRYFALLERQALRRVPWQSVFVGPLDIDSPP
jgi:hypothetical protein